MSHSNHQDGGSPTPIIGGLSAPELAVLARIQKGDANNLLYPAKVVEEAKDPSSPLHKRFDWDDTSAGEKYRLMQARALIACVKITYPDMEPVRYYPHIRTDQNGYRRIEQVIKVEQLRKSFLCQFATDIEMLIAKYRNFADLSGELQSLDKLLQKVQRKVDTKAGPKRKKAA